MGNLTKQELKFLIKIVRTSYSQIALGSNCETDMLFQSSLLKKLVNMLNEV